jgi:hypothetical protein
MVWQLLQKLDWSVASATGKKATIATARTMPIVMKSLGFETAEVWGGVLLGAESLFEDGLERVFLAAMDHSSGAFTRLASAHHSTSRRVVTFEFSKDSPGRTAV